METDELTTECRDRIWRDREGDFWKFIDGTWWYQHPGDFADDWTNTESDEMPDYGPFELVMSYHEGQRTQ